MIMKVYVPCISSFSELPLTQTCMLIIAVAILGTNVEGLFDCDLGGYLKSFLLHRVPILG